jgi:uncharacterized protein
MEINSEDQENNEKRSELDFTNDQVCTISLPKVENIQYEGIQKTSLYVSLITLGIFCLVGIIAALFFIIFSDSGKEYFWYIISALSIVILLLFVIEIKGFKHIGFALREHDVLYKEGLLWRSIVVVPYKRIQHIEVHQGPIDRLFDISSLSLFTAGGSETSIEGLMPDQANSMKAFIMSKNKDLKSTQVIDDESE